MDDIEKQNIRYYDTEAEVYDANRYASLRGRRADSFHKRILDELLFDGLEHTANILELGCGTGRLLTHASERCSNVTGIDISKAMLKVAQSRLMHSGCENVRLIQSHGTTIPFQDNTFDAVYAILVINLVPHYENLLKETARVLKPGGLLVFNVPNLTSIFFPIGWYVNVRKKTMTANTSGYRYSHWFTWKEIKGALEAAGFVIRDIRGEPPHVRLMDQVPPLKGMGIHQWLSKSLYIKAKRQSS